MSKPNKPLLEYVTGPVSLENAFELLTHMGFGDETIYIGDACRAYTINRLYKALEAAKLLEAKANELKHIKYWGGPPGQEGYFVGTFLIYVLDRIMVTELVTKDTQFLRDFQTDFKHERQLALENFQGPYTTP
jgi:hypothetical protein